MLMTECGETQSQIRNALLSTKWNVNKIRKIPQNYATNQNPIIHNSILLIKVDSLHFPRVDINRFELVSNRLLTLSLRVLI